MQEFESFVADGSTSPGCGCDVIEMAEMSRDGCGVVEMSRVE